jgi:hypothetical protein
MSTLRAISLDPRGSLRRTTRFGTVRMRAQLTIGAVGARGEDLAIQVKLDEIRNSYSRQRDVGWMRPDSPVHAVSVANPLTASRARDGVAGDECSRRLDRIPLLMVCSTVSGHLCPVRNDQLRSQRCKSRRTHSLPSQGSGRPGPAGSCGTQPPHPATARYHRQQCASTCNPMLHTDLRTARTQSTSAIYSQ